MIIATPDCLFVDFDEFSFNFDLKWACDLYIMIYVDISYYFDYLLHVKKEKKLFLYVIAMRIHILNLKSIAFELIIVLVFYYAMKW